MEKYELISADELRAKELARFFGKCIYDADFGLVFYESSYSAEFAYLTLQREEMARYRKIASDNAGRELDESVVFEWIRNFAQEFSDLWKHTHIFVGKKEGDAKKKQLGLCACCADDRNGNDVY